MKNEKENENKNENENEKENENVNETKENNNWIYNTKYWIKTTTTNPPIIYLFPISFLHLFYPSSNTINVKIYVTQPNHEWRKTNEENKTNKKNQHINNKNTKWNTLGDAPRPASGGWSIPVWSTATLMKDGIQKKQKPTTQPTTAWNYTIVY